jgi:hypothetical protein
LVSFSGFDTCLACLMPSFSLAMARKAAATGPSLPHRPLKSLLFAASTGIGALVSFSGFDTCLACLMPSFSLAMARKAAATGPSLPHRPISRRGGTIEK